MYSKFRQEEISYYARASEQWVVIIATKLAYRHFFRTILYYMSDNDWPLVNLKPLYTCVESL